VSVQVHQSALQKTLIDCRNARDHAVETWNNIADACGQRLSDADRKVVKNVFDTTSLDRYITKEINTHANSEFSTQMLTIKPLSQTLDSFVGAFERNVAPLLVNMQLVWGMVYYTIKVLSIWNSYHFGSLTIFTHSFQLNHPKS
jgi:hypothetical protein